MLDYILIAFLILCGIALIIAEIIFIPGTTVVGILGFLIGAYGVYRSYQLYGTDAGHIVLVVALTAGLIATLLSFKSGAWKRFALKHAMKVPVNKNMTSLLEIGKEGISISSLKPIGKAAFDSKEYEVTSLGNFIEENTPIKIIKVERNKIIVEPINEYLS